MYATIENSFGRLLSPIEIDMIEEWLKKYPSFEILNALEVANDAKVKNLRYIDSVLRNRELNGEMKLVNQSADATDKKIALVRKLYS